MLKFCKAYHVTPNDILHDFLFLDENEEDFEVIINKLSIRDKKIITVLVKALLENT